MVAVANSLYSVAAGALRRRGWRGAAALLAGSLVVAGAVAVVGRGGGSPPQSPAPDPLTAGADPPTAPTVLVFVSGAVNHPGLYRLTASARVADALAAAGGVTGAADPGRLPNEAARVHDGHQVNVPFLRSTAGGRTARLDVNSATLEELRALPDLPLGLAEAIVELRSRWGRVASMAELRVALGIDRVTASALSRELRVTRPP